MANTLHFFIFLLGIFYAISFCVFKKHPDRFVIEKLVFLIYGCISAYCILWPFLITWCSLFLIQFVLYAGILFCLSMTALSVFVALYPNWCPRAHSNGEEKVTIVLGAPVYDGKPTALLSSRINHTIHNFKNKTGLLIILSGGKKGSISEAELMHQLVSPDISSCKILMEKESLTTDENFLFSKKLLEKYGYSISQPITILTSDFHFFRMRNYAARCGFTNIRYSVVHTPISIAWMWYFREAVVTIRWWILRK